MRYADALGMKLDVKLVVKAKQRHSRKRFAAAIGR
jgi:hypothetical protein